MGKSMWKRMAVLTLAVAMIIEPTCVVHAAENDAENIAEITVLEETTGYSSVEALQDAISKVSEKEFSIRLLKDISTEGHGMFIIPEKKTVTLDLNGCSVNRHLTNAEYDVKSDGEVLIAKEESKLTIIDSDPERIHTGILKGKENNKIWAEEAGGEVKIAGGIITGGASNDGGGGITIKNDASVTMKGGTIAGNYSSMGGGGVLLKNDDSRFVLDGGNILYNGAKGQRGGGVKVENGFMEVISGDICHNWASASKDTDGDGGGIHINYESDRVLYIHGKDTSEDGKESRSVNISDNFAEDEGGGIYLNEGTSTIRNAAIENNTAWDGEKASGGGGIMINDDGTSASPTAIAGCYINNNKTLDSDPGDSEGDGGGIGISNEGHVQIANCLITNNDAADEGGGIYFDASGDDCSIVDSTVTGNHAKRDGGGVYIEDTVTLEGVLIVKDNTADDGRNNLCKWSLKSSLAIGALSANSELFVSNEWGDGEIISKSKTSGSAKGMFSDKDYHFEKDNDPKSSDYRHIKQMAGKTTPEDQKTRVNVWRHVNKNTGRTETNLGSTMTEEENMDPVNGSPVYSGYLRAADCLNTGEDENYTFKFYYSDGLFFNDFDAYDQHLATLTTSLSMASGAASKGITKMNDPAEQRNRFNYLTQAFSDIGCTNESMYVNDCYLRKPEKDTMGVAMANKTIYKDGITSDENAFLLIPIFVRSYNYGPEWISNFTLGDGSEQNGEAYGFSTSADIVMADVETYISQHTEVADAIKEGKAIFWLGGYSRGGGVTNLVSKRLTDIYTGGAEGTDTGNKVIAYCVAAPQGGTEELDKEGGYTNIHNIINKSDIVPYVAPNEMGLKRYGIDHFLPGGAAGEIKTETKKWGPDDKTLTLYSDNTDYEVSYSNDSYMGLRSKFIKQLNVTIPNNEFNDYFHPATINYFWSTEYTNWVPIFGKDLITEESDSSLSTKAKFCQELWARLLKYSANSENAGHDWSKGDNKHKDAKDYRWFYANERKAHFYPGSKYNEEGSATLEETLGTLLGIAMGGEKELDLSNLVDLTGAVEDIALDAYDELIGDLYTDPSASGYTKWIDKIWGLLTEDLSESQKAKGYQNLKDILGEDIDKAESVYPTLLALVFDLVNDDYNDEDQNLLGTLAYNVNDLINDHIINIAWVRADDSWYNKDGDTVYKMNVSADSPEAPAAVLSAATKGGDETEIASGKASEALSSQKLYLRAQPGAAIYYDMTVDGEEVASDELYQGAKGIALPADKAVKITTYAKAYDQKGSGAEYTVNVTDAKYAVGTVHTVKGNKYKILSTKAGKLTVALTKAKNAKNVAIPASVNINKKSYSVVQANAKAFTAKAIRTVTIGKNIAKIKKNAFSRSKATKMIVKTKKLKKATVKGSLKGSKIKTVQVKVGKKKVNRTYVKKYKKIFTKKNAGKKVKVK